MTLAQIRQMPTSLRIGSCGFHESLVRSFFVVAKLRELIAAGAPAPVLLEVADDLMDAPKVDGRFDSGGNPITREANAP